MRNIRYRVFSLRLSEEVREKLIKERNKSFLSWNMFIKKLLESYPQSED